MHKPSHTKQALADLSGKPVNGISMQRLAPMFAKQVTARRRAEDLYEYEADDRVSQPFVDHLRAKAAKLLEQDAESTASTLPVSSVYDALQITKQHRKASTDAGIRAWRGMLNTMWKQNRTANITAESFMKYRGFFEGNFPKSAVSEVFDEIGAQGYASLPVSDLLVIASRIYSQEDYDYEMMKAGLTSKQPMHVKARNFVLAVLNGEMSTQQRRAEDVHDISSAEDTEGTKYHVLPIYRDDALATLVDESTDERTRVPIGDLREFYTLFDRNDQVISSPEDYWEDEREANRRPFERGAQQLEMSVGDPDPEILDMMARTFFVSAWAQEWEYAQEAASDLGYSGIEEAPNFSGAELMDIAPETPPEAVTFAANLYHEIERDNGVNLEEFIPPGEDEDFDRRDFGYCLAMEIMGHGVSWADDHEDHGLRLPGLAGEESELAYADEDLLQILNELDEERMQKEEVTS